MKNIKNTEEFIKANIELKTIRVTPRKALKEDISFPAFKFKDLIKETWEDSDLYNLLEYQKFFFVIFKITTKTISEFNELPKNLKNKYLVLEKVILWNTPAQDIEEFAKPTWEQSIKVLKEWVKITKKWSRFFNNLPASSETKMIHVRPHWKNRNDTDSLPDWRNLTKQCFWFNKKYIAKKLLEL